MRSKPTNRRAKKKSAKPIKHKFEKDVDNPEYGYLREMLGQNRDVAIGNRHPASPYSDPEFDDESDNAKRQKNSSRRFKRYWASLTNAQKMALRMVYIRNPDKLTKAEIARKLGIRVDTLQERIDHAIKKLLKHFPEFDDDNDVH